MDTNEGTDRRRLVVVRGADRVDAVPALLAELDRALAGRSAVLPLPSGPAPEVTRLAAALLPAEPVEDDTALVVPTSGSTGLPKGVRLTASALRSSAEATHARLGGGGTWLLALPATHIAGVQVLVRSLLASAEPVVMAGRGGFRPVEFAEAAGRALAREGRHYTALVPTQLSRVLSEGGDAVRALARFDAVLLGGAACPPALLARARAAGVPVVTTYGMSETAGGCVYDGRPLPGVRFRLADDPRTSPADLVTGDGVGVVELAGPVLAAGYRLDPDATSAAFRDGWFRTGDLGRHDGEGTLEIIGRHDDLINSGGLKIAPVLVERALTAVESVREACVVGLPDAEWGQAVVAVVVGEPTAAPPDPAELRAAVRDQLGAAATPKVVRVVAELPSRGPGKVDRAAVVALFGGR
ncbi:o-succinylbenzoate--CoA ligase [Actinoalloteichus caeruleus]|uniref:O-succinylbenzoic acid--CoA ligase n=1 Tax=Actinoalloteichus caeruleus DSM 43889 TaxID=1120930 RepID=A0ABT1JLG2_ACTCY|nr:o-succinylbenzoate--CoA ligase [Actinoalloteichus caeruleus]MCP2333352.1 O-succinylbenzoic acid--CoA ligase [Actinoalloteichus caeruleus DSM 43889]